MPIELKITWEGEAPGIAEHRLSIAAFGEPLKLLLTAYRRIASNMMRSATNYAEHGRLTDIARLLDIEIAEIEGNSLGVSTVCTFRGAPEMQPAFFPNTIPERASQELVESIARESRGEAYNVNVRNYLAALPPQVRRQQYDLHDNGKALHDSVVIENLNLAAPVVLGLPYLIEFSGTVVGVGFEPGISEVKVKTEDETLRLLARADLVEKALTLRGGLVKGLAVRRKEVRLLRLEGVDAKPFALTDELHESYVFQRWDSLLRKLAQ